LHDGWFAWFAELHRILKPGSFAHILCPHGHSDGALADPTHTRYVMPHTFAYFLEDGQGHQFAYNTGSLWRLQNDQIRYRITEMFAHLFPGPEDTPEETAGKHRQLQLAMMTQINAVYEFYAPLEVVKDGG